MRHSIVSLVAIVPALAVLSCSGTTGTSGLVGEESLAEFLQVPFVAESKQIREMAVVFSAAEPEFWNDWLYTSLNSDIFWEYLEGFKQSRPARWDTLMSRLSYCRVQQLGTPVDADQPDVRWSLFLQNGPPSAEWVTPGECSRSLGDICTTWVLTWVPTGADAEGKAMACESIPGGGYPVHLLAEGDEVARDRGSIFPFVEFWVLPNWGRETHNLWVGTWIPGDQFSQSTLDDGLFQLELRVYERDGRHQGRMAAQKSLSTDLQILRGALNVSRKRRSLRAMGYLDCELKPGDYRVVLSVYGARHNDGKVEHDITIPHDPELSDLLLIRQINARGVNPGISRNGASLYAVPEKEFPQGIEIRTWLEFVLPAAYENRYHVYVSLHPLSPKNFQRKTDVATGPILYIQDENGNPMYGFVAPEEMLEDSKQSNKGITLLDRDYQTTDSVVVFEMPIKLTIRPGNYFLRIDISDARKTRTIGSRSVLIRITPRESMLLKLD